MGRRGQHIRVGRLHERARREDGQGRQIPEVVGHEGLGHGQFDMPNSLAVDAAGKVYVADLGNKRIQVFDNDGNYKTQYTGIGAPWAVCISPGPHQYLFSSNSNPPDSLDNGEIYKMELNGTVIGKFGTAGKGPKEFGTVNEIDCRNPNTLYLGRGRQLARAASYAQIVLLAAGLGVGRAEASVTIAAASNLTDVCQLLGAEFESGDWYSSGLRLRVHGGADAADRERRAVTICFCGRFEHPEKLDREGLAGAGKPGGLRHGRARDVGSAASHAKIERLEDLASSDVRVIAVARSGACALRPGDGRDADEAGPVGSREAKVVYSDNISMAKQYGTSGNADAAFTAWSLVLAEKGKVVPVEEGLHKPITQELGVLAHSANQDAARSFASFLANGKGRDIMAAHGYRTGRKQ